MGAIVAETWIPPQLKVGDPGFPVLLNHLAQFSDFG